MLPVALIILAELMLLPMILDSEVKFPIAPMVPVEYNPNPSVALSPILTVTFPFAPA